MKYILFFPDGKHYYKDGNIHRDDGPAKVYTDGDIAYYNNGVKHRVNGPAVEYSFGRKEYWYKGKLSRLDGPAIESPYVKIYYYNNMLIDCDSTEEFQRKIKLLAFL